MFKIVLYLLFSTILVQAAPSICDYTQYKECYDILKRQSRSGNASYPTATSGAFTNPASVNMDRGFGLEILNPDYGTQVGLVSGTGRIGAAISNNPNDETFFGNIAIEDTERFKVRDVKNQMYQSDKIALGLGFNLYGKNKSKNKWFNLDGGVVYRYNPDSEKHHAGGGLSLGLTPYITLGYSTYKDDYYFDARGLTMEYASASGTLTTATNGTTDSFIYDYQYQVSNSMLSVKFWHFAFDYSYIQTEFENITESDVEIIIRSFSYFHGKWMFSYGHRTEQSYRAFFNEDVKAFLNERKKTQGFLGFQYSITKNIILGIFSNYFLQNETSLGLTIFL